MQINKGSFLRRSLLFSAADLNETRVENGNDANTRGPSKPRESKINAGNTEKGNSSMKRAQTNSEENKKLKAGFEKQRRRERRGG